MVASRSAAFMVRARGKLPTDFWVDEVIDSQTLLLPTELKQYTRGIDLSGKGVGLLV